MNFLRVLWVDSQDREKVFQHKRMVFSTSSSPFLFGATIEFHLMIVLEKYINVTEVYTMGIILQLLSSFYVDNCVTSVSNYARDLSKNLPFSRKRHGSTKESGSFQV